MTSMLTGKDLPSEIAVSCVLHVGPSTDNTEIKCFTMESWNKVKLVAEKRLKRFKSSKYSDICKKIHKLDFDRYLGFHSACLKNFTAISKFTDSTKTDTPQASSSSQMPFLRSSLDVHTSTRTGVLSKVCIFCNQVTKKRHNIKEALGNCESFNAQERIKHAAQVMKDNALLAKIGDIDFVAKEVKYHHSCRKSYLNSAQWTQSNPLQSE